MIHIKFYAMFFVLMFISNSVSVGHREPIALLMNVHYLQGEVNRSAGSHHMNRQSSRSHSIFTIYLEVRAQ